MKRTGNLWAEIVTWENLVLAARKAQRGKRDRAAVCRFNFSLEPELLRLQRELNDGTYRPGAFTSHWITVPKPRLISAAPYRDRVVHHAIMNVLEPVLEKRFHPHSFACRAGKGTHAAADRLQWLMRSNRFALQCDVRKFFPSIDHDTLKQVFRRSIKDRRLLELLDLIVDCSNEQERVTEWFGNDCLFDPLERRRGLPIGNLTSQWFANWYLNGFDHYVSSGLGIGAYVRYCDDFVLLSNDRSRLERARDEVKRYLGDLRLRLHEGKTAVVPTRCGMTFVGYRIYPTHRLVRKANIRRFGRRLRWMKSAYANGKLPWAGVVKRLDSWMAHARQANSERLIRRLSRTWRFSKAPAPERVAAEEACPAGRFLEQQPEELPLCQPQQERAGQPEQQHRFPCCPALVIPESSRLRTARA